MTTCPSTTLKPPSPRSWTMRVLALLAALALLAGCVGGSEGDDVVPEAVQALTGPSEEELARTPGALAGIVHTAALAPIPGARIEEPRLGLNATTDAAGFFRLEGLVTGEHLLNVVADGFLTKSVKAHARNGTTLEVNVSLDPAPSSEPYVEPRELAGFLTCAVLVQGEAHDCASADPNHRDVFEFELAGEGKLVVLELVYDPANSPAGSALTLAVETVGYGAQDVDLGNATGEGYARIVVPTAIMEKYYPEGGMMRARVSLAPGAAPVVAAAQLSFTVFVTTFYHEAGDEAYSVLSG